MSGQSDSPHRGSPVSDDGRGLKRSVLTVMGLESLVRPSVMTGVD